MELQVFNLDAAPEEDAVCKLSKGEHTIGRGPLLRCDDKRVSRNHAAIKVSQDGAIITSLHQNPCFYQLADSKTIVILKKDVAHDIKDGDKFGLFPDKFWFRIKLSQTNGIKHENDLENLKEEANESNSNDSLVFNLNDEPLEPANNSHDTTNKENITDQVDDNSRNEGCTTKREELSDEEINEEVEIKVEEVSDLKNDETIEGEVKKEELPEAKNEVLSDVDDETPDLLPNGVDCTKKDERKEIKKENYEDGPTATAGGSVNDGDGNNDANQASSSNTNKRKRRGRCIYGDKCYRKNPIHKHEFSHPGDSDYESDPDDKRPMCNYGADCYRMNKDHRQQYRHPKTSGPPSKQRKLRNRKPKKPSTKDESSEDDYDYDDPFLNDDSDDEYKEESWSEDSDTDWKDSQVVDDDNETKTLLKEAKRFTRGRKKKDD